MNIGVIFGSRSVEHDVSIASGYAIVQGLIKSRKYNVFPIYITREGQWIYDPKFADLNSFRDINLDDYKNSNFQINFSKSEKLYAVQNSGGMFGKKTKLELDFIFPILHGMNGEDGTIHGIFDMLQVPYMGPSVEGSAVGMNKVTMKRVFQSLNIPITDYLVFTQSNYDAAKVESSGLSFPLIVKPANLGSSIGISKVETKEDLQDAVEVAFHYDTTIIIEKCVENLMELNCSVMKYNAETVTSLVEQPIGSTEFLSFEEKYVSAEGGTMQGVKNRVKIPANIDDELASRIQGYCKVIFEDLYCRGGVPRIDFLYDSVKKELYVNEINTIPGALQMHLWQKSGYEVSDFLKAIIETGKQNSLDRKLNIDFESNIIGHTIAFTK